jgi:hypothetical protein
MEISRIGLKIYQVNSSKREELIMYLNQNKPQKYKDKLLISFEKTDFNSEDSQKKIENPYKSDECYLIKIDRPYSYNDRKGRKEIIETREYYLVLREINGTTYMLCFMPKTFIQFFEKRLYDEFSGKQIIQNHQIMIDDIPSKLFNYRKFTLDKIASPMVSKISAEGDDMAKGDLYKKYHGMKGKVQDVLICKKDILIRMYPEGYFIINCKMSIDERIKFCMSIIKELEKNNLIKKIGWNRELNEFLRN